MTSVVAALDTYTPKQLGENLHPEYSWSNSDEEKLVQLFFQLTRCDKDKMNELAKQYKTLLETSIRTDNRALTDLLYKLVVQTRDIVSGKGEYRLSWTLLNQLDKSGLGIMTRKIIHYLVNDLPIEGNKHPYGSWRDIKYLWTDFEWSKETSDYMVELLNNQIKQDYDKVMHSTNNENVQISLAGKWAPREKGAYAAFFKVLAKNYFSQYIETAKNYDPYSSDRMSRAVRKTYSDYRKVLTTLNRYLDTTQIKQCEGNYSSINYDNVTSVTLNRQRYAFKNVNKNGMTKYPDNHDRVSAAQLFNDWVFNKVTNKETIKGSRVGINDLVKSALELRYNSSSTDTTTRDLVNAQWLDNGKNIGDLGNIIPVCDISGSMTSDEALNSAVGLSIRVAENSRLGRRVMSFSSQPTWIKLQEGDSSFVNNVHAIMDGPVGYNTNFTASLTLLLEACLAARLTSDEVGNLVLAVFSDMQIDSSGNEHLSDTMWDHIKRKFKSYGYDKVPHILFWNLRSTSGFPTLSTQNGASMFSGFSPALLNMFCEKGNDFLAEVTPIKMLLEMLSHERYNTLIGWNY